MTIKTHQQVLVSSTSLSACVVSTSFSAAATPSNLGELYPLMVAPLGKSEVPLFRQAAWSPVGCAPSGGCLIAAFTTGRHIKVYTPSYPERRAEWTEVADLSADLRDYHESTSQREAQALSAKYMQMGSAVATQQRNASSLDIDTNGVLTEVLPAYVQSASGVLHRQPALQAAMKKAKPFQGRFPQVGDNVEVFSASKGPWGCWQPAQVTEVRARTVTVQLHSSVSEGADAASPCKVSLADARTAVPMPIKPAMTKKGRKKIAKQPSREEATAHILVPHIRPLRENTQGDGQPLALQQCVEVLYEGSWWPGIVQKVEQRKVQCAVLIAGEAKATSMGLNAVRPLDAVWKDASWMPINKAIVVMNEKPSTPAQASARDQPSTSAIPKQVAASLVEEVITSQGAQRQKRKRNDQACKISAIVEEVFNRFAATRERIPKHEREVYEAGQHLRKQDLKILEEALDSVVQAYQQEMAEAGLTTKELIKLAKIRIRTTIINTRVVRVVTPETMHTSPTRASDRERCKATQNQETPDVPLSLPVMPGNLRQLARFKAKGKPLAAVPPASGAMASAINVPSEAAKGKVTKTVKVNQSDAQQAHAVPSTPETVIVNAANPIDALAVDCRETAPTQNVSRQDQPMANEGVETDPTIATSTLPKGHNHKTRQHRGQEQPSVYQEGLKNKQKQDAGPEQVPDTSGNMLERTANFGALRDMLTPMSLDWSPVISAPVCKDYNQLLDAPASTPFVLLAVGTKAGSVILWRMQLPEQYSSQAGGEVSGSPPFTLAGSFDAHTSWTSALCWVSEHGGTCPTHQRNAMLLVSASATGVVRLWAVDARAAVTADARASQASGVCVDLLLELCPADDMNISVLTAVHTVHGVLVAADKGPGRVVTWRLALDDSGCFQLVAMRQRALHNLHATGLAFSADGSVLYSTSKDGTRYVWNLDDSRVIPLNDVLVNIPLTSTASVLQTTVSATTNSPIWGLALSSQHQFVVTVTHIPRMCLTQLQRRVCHSLVHLHGVSIASVNKPFSLSSSIPEQAWHLLTAVAATPVHSPLTDVAAFLAGMSAKHARQLVYALEEQSIPLCEAQLQGGGEGSSAESARAAWRAVQLAVALRRHFASQWKDDDDDNEDLTIMDSTSVTASSLAHNEHLVRQWLAGWRMRMFLQEQVEDARLEDAVLAAANWVDTSFASVADSIRASAADIRNKFSMQCAADTCWRDTCPLCKSTLTKGQDDSQGDGVEALQCASQASHRVSRCMTCFKACFSPSLWRCDCCGRRSCVAPPSPSLPPGWRGARPPCCPFCGVLLGQCLPQSMLAPTLA